MNIYRSQFHYYDEQGSLHPFTSDHSRPTSREYQLTEGSMVRLFVNFNPWKLTSHSDERVAYQYCLFCATRRFSRHDHFEAIKAEGGQSAICCTSEKCELAFWHFIGMAHSDTIRSILLLSRPSSCTLV